MVFVLLVTCLGSSLLGTARELLHDPTSVFALLADSLPMASHFYLDYIVYQWLTHAMGVLKQETKDHEKVEVSR